MSPWFYVSISLAAFSILALVRREGLLGLIRGGGSPPVYSGEIPHGPVLSAQMPDKAEMQAIRARQKQLYKLVFYRDLYMRAFAQGHKLEESELDEAWAMYETLIKKYAPPDDDVCFFPGVGQ
jgi:hypothetical protein